MSMQELSRAQKLENGQPVIVFAFGDGKENRGTVCGVSFDPGIIEHMAYIVKLDKPDAWNHSYDCIAVPRACLRILPAFFNSDL